MPAASRWCGRRYGTMRRKSTKNANGLRLSRSRRSLMRPPPMRRAAQSAQRAEAGTRPGARPSRPVTSAASATCRRRSRTPTRRRRAARPARRRRPALRCAASSAAQPQHRRGRSRCARPAPAALARFAAHELAPAAVLLDRRAHAHAAGGAARDLKVPAVAGPAADDASAAVTRGRLDPPDSLPGGLPALVPARDVAASRQRQPRRQLRRQGASPCDAARPAAPPARQVQAGDQRSQHRCRACRGRGGRGRLGQPAIAAWHRTRRRRRPAARRR